MKRWSWIPSALVLIVVATVNQAVIPCSAQDDRDLPEWLLDTRDLGRKSVSTRLLPNHRNGEIVVSSGAYDVYRTIDGRVFTNEFDTLLGFYDWNGRVVHVDDSGAILYQGMYGTRTNAHTVVGLRQADGRYKYRRLLEHPSNPPFGMTVEGMVAFAKPTYVASLYSYSTAWSRSLGLPVPGVWWSKEYGRTVAAVPIPVNQQFTNPQLFSPSASCVALLPDEGNWLLIDMRRTDGPTTSVVPTNMRKGWQMFPNGRIVGISGDYVADDTLWVYDSDGQVLYSEVHQRPYRGVQEWRNIQSQILRVSDTACFILLTTGDVFAVSENSAIPRLLYRSDKPSVLRSYGMLQSKVVLALGLGKDRGVDVVRYVGIDVSTGTVWQQDGSAPSSTAGVSIFWLGDSTLLMAVDAETEVLASYDRGKTWQYPEIRDQHPGNYWWERHLPARQIVEIDSVYPDVMTMSGALVHAPSSDRNVVRTFARGVVSQRDESRNHSSGIEFHQHFVRPFRERGTLLMGGDSLTIRQLDGRILRTLLPRRTTYARELSPGLWIAGHDSVWLSFNDGREWVFVGRTFPHVDLRFGSARPLERQYVGLGSAVLATDGSILVGFMGTKTRAGGLYRSTDFGNTWFETSGISNLRRVTDLERLESGTLLALTTETDTSWALTVGESRELVSQRSTLFRSVDHGRTWAPVLWFGDVDRHTRSNPHFRRLDGEIHAIIPERGIFRYRDDGATWGLLDVTNLPNTRINDAWMTSDGWLHVASDSGYVRIRREKLTSVDASGNHTAGLVHQIRVDYREDTRELELPADIKDGACIIVADIRGVVVYHSAHTSGYRHRLPDLPTGSYIAAVRTAHGVTSMPLVIVR